MGAGKLRTGVDSDGEGGRRDPLRWLSPIQAIGSPWIWTAPGAGRLTRLLQLDQQGKARIVVDLVERRASIVGQPGSSGVEQGEGLFDWRVRIRCEAVRVSPLSSLTCQPADQAIASALVCSLMPSGAASSRARAFMPPRTAYRGWPSARVRPVPSANPWAHSSTSPAARHRSTSA
jgi:hypothetical protein